MPRQHLTYCNTVVLACQSEEKISKLWPRNISQLLISCVASEIKLMVTLTESASVLSDRQTSHWMRPQGLWRLSIERPPSQHLVASVLISCTGTVRVHILSTCQWVATLCFQWQHNTLHLGHETWRYVALDDMMDEVSASFWQMDTTNQRGSSVL